MVQSAPYWEEAQKSDVSWALDRQAADVLGSLTFWSPDVVLFFQSGWEQKSCVVGVVVSVATAEGSRVLPGSRNSNHERPD